MMSIDSSLDTIAQSVVRVKMPFESDFDNGAVQVGFLARPLLETPELKKFFVRQCRLDMQLGSNMSQEARAARQKAAYEQLLRSASNLAATSITLVSILRQLNGHLIGADLSRVYLVNGNLDGLNLSGAKLVGSYFAGIARDFTCISCDLSGANFKEFRVVGQRSLADAKQDGTQWE